MWKKTFSSLALIWLFIDFSSSQDLTIELPDGRIEGREAKTYANTTYYAFQQIPYAAPPIGELRFKAPQSPPKWEGTLDTTKLDVSCFQLQQFSELPTTISEDCLYLNVFTPQLPQRDDNVSLPVMLFIHGGAFLSGSSVDRPPDLFVDNGVILVTINYRLGLFGFLSTGDEVIPGNNGLKDQRLAIQWTHENIHLFGGDPEKITVFGQSAGSTSVAYQLLNLDSEGLIRGAILESGSSICPWGTQRNARRIAFETAAILNSSFVDSEDSEALLEFLQSVDAEELNAVAEEYLNSVSTPWDYDVSQGVTYGPVIEVKNADAFITKKMYGLLQAGSVLRIPTMIGFNSEENLVFNTDPEVLQSILQAWDENLDLIVPNDMQISDPEEHAAMALQIRDIYTNGEPFGNNLGAGVRVVLQSKLFFLYYSSDTSFTRPVVRHAELLSQYTETYFYQFAYDGELGGFPIYYDGTEYVGHSEELYYLFCSGDDCNFDTYPESDQITSKRLIKMWTDFAKYQNPTPEASEVLENIIWPQLSVEDGDFFYLNINGSLEIRNHPKQEVYQKWTDLYNSLNFSDFDTY